MTNEKPRRIADLLADLTFVPLDNGMERATINGVQIVRQNGRYWIMTHMVLSGATLARRTSIPLWIICSESESGDGRPPGAAADRDTPDPLHTPPCGDLSCARSFRRDADAADVKSQHEPNH
jgi:hypothetical protein